jgi:predicted ATPase/class 3 adenylate cyclase
MTFDEVLGQVRELLQQRGRVTYRSLKLRYQLDDDLLAGVTDELIKAERVAVDESGEVLVWTGGRAEGEKARREKGENGPEFGFRNPESEEQGRASTSLPLDSAAERRQLTVMFCDLVGSTALSERLDPEELREVVQAYQETCTEVIRRYDGHIAQHLGDGLLVYFGYPLAHEDDAARAVRAGLEIISAIQEKVPFPLVGEPVLRIVTGRQDKGTEEKSLQVRIGIHTGLVVIGEIGSSEKREVLAPGETPNIAARLQGLAEPDTVMLSAVTQRLIAGLFECRDLSPLTLKGISTPLSVYQVVGESQAQSRFDAVVRKGLTPLVGREEELGLLRRRWDQAKTGNGQAVLLSGEPGIGKSRLVQALTEHILTDGATRIEFRCSAYHQNSAFYPILEHLRRLLAFVQDDTPQVKLAKLQQILSHYHFPQADTFPLLAALLSLPHPDGVPPLTLSPQKQKQKTQEALVAWIIEEAEKATVYCTWEDLHWADPSTLEVLTIFLDQVPTARLLAALTFRPDFTPPWKSRSHISHLALSRLGRSQVEIMVDQVAGGKTLPKEVIQQIVSKTDGVPLFVEELTKSVVETVGVHGHALLQSLDIPATLQDSLMARLDRLGATKEIAQGGAVLGREFSYELLHAVSPINEETLQHGLRELVEAELVYRRGVLPQATYLFKHALIQDTAYQSLLKSKRQKYHQLIAKMLEERFPQIVEIQPEFVAHHFTEAGLGKQAILYWQKAGQRASQRSAHVEAIAHLSKALDLLKTLPDIPERTQQELMLQIVLGGPLMATKGYAAPEVERVYARARELCQQMGETPQLFPVLYGLFAFSLVRAEYQTAHELGEQLLRLAQSVQTPALLVEAHFVLGQPLFFLGELSSACEHFEQGIALYNPQKHNPYVSGFAQDSGVACLSFIAWILWLRGYPDQAFQRIQEALALAQELSHPFSLAYALICAAWLHQHRREGHLTQERAEATITLSVEQGFVLWLAWGTIQRGWALAVEGQTEEGIQQIRQGLAAFQATGAEVWRPYHLALLAEAYGKVGRIEEGLTVLAEALTVVDNTGERLWEAELYRLKGTLTLQSKVQAPKSKAEKAAEECFLTAIDIARKQQAKSLELRAVMSLARLWQQLGKRTEAHQMLAEIYNWFTEGFDTKDLQEAEALIEELKD